VPLLEGVDGAKKMSKSTGNHIALTDAPNDQFGKVMRIPDESLARYARLAANWSQAEVDRMVAGITAGTLTPMEEKKRIGAAVVALYHGADAARAAREHFERTIQRRETPEQMDLHVVTGSQAVVDIVFTSGLAESKRAAGRLIAAGAVRIDGQVVQDPRATWKGVPAVLQVGARKFVRVVPPKD